MQRNAPRYNKYTKLATKLSQVCEPTSKQEIKKTQADVENRWQSISTELTSRLDNFRECLNLWNKYEEEYGAAKTWLDAKEKLCEELLYGKEPRTRRDDNLKNCLVGVANDFFVIKKPLSLLL